MSKFTFTNNSFYLATFTDGSTLKFVYLGNSPERPDPLIEANGKRYLFKHKISKWLSIEELSR